MVYEGRTTLMDPDKARFAQKTDARKLAEVIEGRTCSWVCRPGACSSRRWWRRWVPAALILALANPTPEILPEVAHGVRDDVVMATGRSDYPNQVNNVLCFPYIFRGAGRGRDDDHARDGKGGGVRDRGAGREEQNEVVAAAYGTYDISFGADYLIPKPFDPRLIVRIAPAVAKAAMEGGVATRPLADLEAYEEQLQQFVYHSGAFMKPLFSAAKRIVRGGGKSASSSPRAKMSACCAPQVIVDEGLARPILVGRPPCCCRASRNSACACAWARTWKSPTPNMTNASISTGPRTGS